MKILIHFSHYETLGHTTRIYNICNYLKKYNKNLIIKVLQGGKEQNFLTKKNSEIDLINIPESFVDRTWITSTKKKLIDPKKIKIRTIFVSKIIKNFKPDIFITEFFPFGRKIDVYEILPILKYLKDKHPQIKIISSIGYPILNFEKKKIIEYSSYYDKILIHTPKLDYELIIETYRNLLNNNKISQVPITDYRKIFKILENKIFFTNYIIPSDLERKSKKNAKLNLNLSQKPLILVSRGGGVMYPKIISSSMTASKYLDNYQIVAISGPATTATETKIFEKLSKLYNINLINYTDKFANYLNAADISISMSGYNTVVQNLFLRNPSIFFPKLNLLNRGEVEQLYRIKLYSKFIPNKVLNYSMFSPKDIAVSVENLINKNSKLNSSHLHIKKSIPEIFFSGGENTSKEILNTN